MTTTDKAVKRRTRNEYRVLYPSGSTARPVVVAILPGDVLEFREHGRRDRWTLAIDTAFKYAVRVKAFADSNEEARKRKERGLKPRKKGRRRG